MKVELSKREIGFIVVALSRYIKRHELFSEIDNLSMGAIALHMKELSEAALLQKRLDEIFCGKKTPENTEELDKGTPGESEKP